MKEIVTIVVAALAAFLVSSCETTGVPPGPGGPDPGHGHGAEHRDDAQPLPRIGWELKSAGVGYDLDVTIDGEETHLATGGEYVGGKKISRTSRNVPAGAASAFEVLLPDGEIDLYWVEEGRPGTLLIYSKTYDAIDNAWSSERRLRSVSY